MLTEVSKLPSNNAYGKLIEARPSGYLKDKSVVNKVKWSLWFQYLKEIAGAYETKLK